MCGGSTCKIVVMADWQFLRTGNKLNNHRSMHTCLFACTASACLSRAPCAAPPALASRLRMQLHGAPERSASARVQEDGGAIAMFKGELVFDGVAISDTSATVRRPSAARAGRPLRPSCVRRACAGPVPCAGWRRRNRHVRWRRHVPREQHDHAHAGGAPGPAHAIARARAIVVLVCGASTGTGTRV